MECAYCRFWRRDPITMKLRALDGTEAIVTLRKAPTSGHCCINPPQLTNGEDRWPKTQQDEFCGKFEPGLPNAPRDNP